VTEPRRKRQYVILPAAEVVSETPDPAPAAVRKSRHELIAEAAYRRAVRRKFRDGDPVSDWLAAEAEIDGMLARKETD
jgi:hypothetical protein